MVRAVTGRGEPLGEATYTIGEARTATATFDLPLEIRNQVARIEIAGEHSAGAVYLLDARSQWHRVGIVSGESREAAQPLLSPLYYVKRALSPTPTSSRRARAMSRTPFMTWSSRRSRPSCWPISASWWPARKRSSSLGQVGRRAHPFRRTTARARRRRAAARGLAPRRPLAWRLAVVEHAAAARAVRRQSPFRGLAVPDDVKVNRQVLADPTVASEAEIWATLADGTPLVTAAKRGQGFIVLFHVTANSDWSNLPLSGLFVEMLRRVVALGPSQVEETRRRDKAAAKPSNAAQPNRRPDGRAAADSDAGRLRPADPPPLRAAPIAPDKIDTIVPGPDHPPGYYGPSGAARAFNLITAKTALKPLGTIEGSSAGERLLMKKPVALEPWLYLAAIGLFVADILAMLVLSGGLRFRRRARASSPPLARAHAAQPCRRRREGRANAGIRGGSRHERRRRFRAEGLASDASRLCRHRRPGDRPHQRGRLSGLSKVLRARTALEPAEPMGVDIDKDELSFFPILYWPVREDASPLSDATLAKVDAFMKQGGLIVFDTRDHETGFGTGAQGKALTRLIGQLDIPPLEPVPESHVLTKSFYLMRSFPGRWDGGSLWVEAEPDDEAERSERSRRTDGVSSIVITSNDLAGAWALDEANRPIYPAVPGGEVQREMAFRAGVNIVMYALTGNYKADQVHVPALLERLGQ